MNVGIAISSIYPGIIIDVDFTLTPGGGEITEWISTEYTQPTQQALDNAWTAYTIEQEITQRTTEMRKIRQEIRSYGGNASELNHPKLDEIDNAKIEELKSRFDTLKLELDTYDQTLVDSIIDSLFT